jgi:hypothetical protein
MLIVEQRVIVKPNTRVLESPTNDNTGRSLEPREIFLNKVIHSFENEIRGNFSEMFHSSYHHSASKHYMCTEFTPSMVCFGKLD